MQDLSTLVDEIAAAGNGVVMTMGKGGVGKTTVAAAIAVALVQTRTLSASLHHRSGSVRRRSSGGRTSRSHDRQN